MGSQKDLAIAQLDKRRAANAKAKERKYGRAEKGFGGAVSSVPAELFKWAALKVIENGCGITFVANKAKTSLAIVVLEEGEPFKTWCESEKDVWDTLEMLAELTLKGATESERLNRKQYKELVTAPIVGGQETPVQGKERLSLGQEPLPGF